MTTSRSVRSALLHVALLIAATVVTGLSTGGAIAGCGPAAQPIVVTGPFTEEHASAFENGVDFDSGAGDGLDWLSSWEEEVDRRVQLADAVALVTITTLRQDVDLDRHETYRLIAHVERVRHGHVPDEITLAVRHDQPGFGTVRGNDHLILNQRFVAFVKWAEEDGQIVARWHLSPATERVVRRVNSLVERLHTEPEERRRVIVRETGGEASDED